LINQKTREKNKELIKRYPFLMPYAYINDGQGMEKYNYEFTMLDDMPYGWRRAFAPLLLEELKAALEEDGLLETYRIDQIKEKWGSLHWYHRNFNDKADLIIDKYSEISEHVCAYCGKPDVSICKVGWVFPCCKECWEKNSGRVNTIQYEEAVDKASGNEIKESFAYRIYPNFVIVDISDTVKKVRERWKKLESDEIEDNLFL